MDTQPEETVVDKAVAFVKDIFGIEKAPVRDEEGRYSDSAPEAAAENAMRLDPNAYVVNTAGQMTTDSFVAPTADRHAIDEYPREKSALELNAESARREDGGA